MNPSRSVFSFWASRTEVALINLTIIRYSSCTESTSPYLIRTWHRLSSACIKHVTARLALITPAARLLIRAHSGRCQLNIDKTNMYWTCLRVVGSVFWRKIEPPRAVASASSSIYYLVSQSWLKGRNHSLHKVFTSWWFGPSSAFLPPS